MNFKDLSYTIGFAIYGLSDLETLPPEVARMVPYIRYEKDGKMIREELELKPCLDLLSQEIIEKTA